MATDADLLSLTESSTLLFFVFDRSAGEFTYVNARFLDFFDRQTAPDDPSELFALVHDDDRSYISDQFRRLISGEAVEPECRFIRNGHERTLRIFGRVEPQAGGQLVLGHAEDITVYQDYNQTLAAHGNKKNAILNILTHDLAGPIGSIGNFCELIHRNLTDESDKQLRKHIDTIQKISKGCIRLIRDFLDQEFLESAGVRLVKRRTDMAAKLREIADEYQGMQPAMKIEVLCRAPEHPVFAALDGDKFSQVIQNLISNALKFTPDGGTITLDLKEEKEHIIVIVADTGIGIPAQYHQSLFEKFSEARRTGLHGEHSTGLGMSIIKTIVEWHGGRVWFESEENKGTTFYISVPKPKE